MSGDITRISMTEAVKEDRTDWQRVRALTDAQIDAAIESDPDTFAMDDKRAATEKTPLEFVYFIYSDGGGEWRWRLERSDGRVVAHGAEAYATQNDVTRAVAALRAAFRTGHAA
jgi:uncharacterized protein YegP (UPF0339 family)